MGRIISVVIGFALPCLLAAQARSNPPSLPPDLTQEQLFRSFFLHVAATEAAAAKIQAKGLDDSRMRAQIRSSIHLTDHEDTIVKTVARNCNADYATETQAGMAAVRQLRQQYPNLSQASPEVAQQLAVLEQRRDSVIAGCIHDLKSQMPDYRFDLIYDWAIRNVAPQINGTSSTPPIGQNVLSHRVVSVDSPRPLAEAAEILTTGYGVPISYEDVSAYADESDLADITGFLRSHPDSKTISPRSSRLMVTFDAPTAPSLIRPSTSANVSKALETLLRQHESNDNPGRFKVIETAAGLAVVPVATRNSLGMFVSDHSPLDLQISFPEVDTDADSGLRTFSDALSAASGKRIKLLDSLFTMDVKIGAHNEVARDVFARLLSGLRNRRGNGSVHSVPKFAWTLTMEPGISAPHSGDYSLSLRTVRMELTTAHSVVPIHPIYQCATPAIDCYQFPGEGEQTAR